MLPSQEHIYLSVQELEMDAQEPKQALSHLNLKQRGSRRSRPRCNQVIIEGEDEACGSTSIESSSEDSMDSSSSSSSFSSSDSTEDASSSSSTSSSLNGPLYDLSELMSHLPIKRGLSKFYEGKSQSFTSLAIVKSVEDLVKKECSNNTRRIRMKSCKSFGGALDHSRNRTYSPKATISKKGTRTGSVLSSPRKIGALLDACRH